MRKEASFALAISVVLGLALLFLLQQQNIRRLLAENAELRSQVGQIGSLEDTNERLTGQLKTAVAALQTNQNELLRLRGQGSKLRQLEQENARLKSERQPAVVSSEQRQVTAVSEVVKETAEKSRLDTTDLGPLELQSGVAVQFDLGGGTNCIVTSMTLPDGNNVMEIKVGVTNADGSFSELGKSGLTARPGQHCFISVSDRMIGLAVTVKP